MSGLSAGVTATLGGATPGRRRPERPDTLSQSLNEIENLTGGDGEDVLQGDGAKNILDGGPGDDTLRGLGGDDTLDGAGGDDLLEPGTDGGSNTGGSDGTAGGAHGAGGDTVSYVGLSAPVTATLGGAAAGTASAPSPAALLQAINGVENLTGGDDDDVLNGDGAVNRLAGGHGQRHARGPRRRRRARRWREHGGR